MEIIGTLKNIVKVPGEADGEKRGVRHGPGDVAFELKDTKENKAMVDKWIEDGFYVPSGSAKKAEPVKPGTKP